MTNEQLIQRAAAAHGFPLPNPYNCGEWGVRERAGVEMYVWIRRDADIDAYIDARRYAADYDLRVRIRSGAVVPPVQTKEVAK